VYGKPDAVLLDRDGTVNVKAPDGRYVTNAADLRLLPGAAQAIRALNDAGVPVAIVTNQRGIALGCIDETDLEAVHMRLRELLSEERAHVDGIFHCPHEKGVCRCRKPGTMLLRRAQAHFGLATLRRSVMIGDSRSDVVAGWRAGARSILLTPVGVTSPNGTESASSLLEAVHRILSEVGAAADLVA